jgi:hypothetical protein
MVVVGVVVVGPPPAAPSAAAFFAACFSAHVPPPPPTIPPGFSGEDFAGKEDVDFGGTPVKERMGGIKLGGSKLNNPLNN